MCSWRTGPRCRPPMTTARSRRCGRAGAAARGSASCAARPPASRTRRISPSPGWQRQPPRPRPRPRRAVPELAWCRWWSGVRRRPHLVATLPETVAKARKVEMMARADDAARAESDAITQVTASYADGRRRILVANSDGVLASDDQVRTRFAVTCVASGDTGLQTGIGGARAHDRVRVLRRASARGDRSAARPRAP